MSRKKRLQKRIINPIEKQLVNDLKSCQKESKSHIFEANEPKHDNRKGDLIDSKNLTYQLEDIDGELKVVVQVDKEDGEKFKFQLFHEQVPFPFFRYDAQGEPHINRKEPLGKSVIKCPHFNTFDSEGDLIAYRTDIIDQQEEALKNHDFALHNFAVETNMVFEKPPTIETPATLFKTKVVANSMNQTDF